MAVGAKHDEEDLLWRGEDIIKAERSQMEMEMEMEMGMGMGMEVDMEMEPFQFSADGDILNDIMEW